MLIDNSLVNYEINGVMEAYISEHESLLVGKILHFVGIYENDEKDGDVANQSYFTLEMTDLELGTNVLYVLDKTETERTLVIGSGRHRLRNICVIDYSGIVPVARQDVVVAFL